jgi:uncharacterized protein involved in oxidation of intracellular sulfur
MADKVLVVLSCGTDNPNRATRGLMLASLASKLGKESAVFLLDEGVFLAKKGLADNLKAATGDSADDHMTYLREFEVPVLACTPCAVARGIQESDLIENARMATGEELLNMAAESTVISL